MAKETFKLKNKRTAQKAGKPVVDDTKPPLPRDEIKALWSSHKDSLHPYITEMYKNYFMYSNDRKAQLEKDKETRRSNLKSPLTHMFVNGIYNMLQDADIRFTCVDIK